MLFRHLRRLFRRRLLGAYVGAQGAPLEQGLYQVASQRPRIVVFPEELGEVVAAAGYGTRQAEARV